LFVALGLEKVDFCEQLILFLFKLCNFLFKVSWVHGLRTETLNIHMSCLEFSLKIFINLEGIAHFIINQEFIWNGEGPQEFVCVSLSLQLLKPRDYPIENVLECAFVTMDDVSLEVGVKI